MALKLDSSPVQTQTSVQISPSGGCRRGLSTGEKSVMLSPVMDCMDSSCSVKRRLFPDFDVLKLSTLLLKDNLSNVEILGQSKSSFEVSELVEEMVNAINNAVEPIRVYGGLSGAYCFRNRNGEPIAIVKPTDEEPFGPNNPKSVLGNIPAQSGVIRSVRIGETGYREVAAYLLDHDHFAKVPLTALIKISHPIFNGNKIHSKIASIQKFVPHDFDASEHGTMKFPVSDVHRIGILDIRIFNTDRHAGNILVRKLCDKVGLVPIDHGLCLPEFLEDPYFEWMHWHQASIPFSDEECEYIKNLDPIRDCETLRLELPMIKDACLRILVLCTIFLKKAAKFGLCLAEIGEIMSRAYRYPLAEPSELEVICMEAKRVVVSRSKDMIFDTSEYRLHSFVDENNCINDTSPVYKTTQNVLRRSAKEVHYVSVADLSDEEWGDFLIKFQELLGYALADRKSCSIIGGKQRHRYGSSCQF